MRFLNKKWKCYCVGLWLSGEVAVAQPPLDAEILDFTEETAEVLTVLDQITITATRRAQALRDVPGTVTVTSRSELDRTLSQNIADAVRYEPGIAVDSEGRFGLSGFRIRGIGGNRVLTVIDGIPINDEFSFGPFQNTNRDFIDLDVIETLEIVRGPGSALYGSDALGGIVAFRTKDPDDYLGVFNQNYYLSAKAAYASRNREWQGTATVAAQNPTETVQGMVVYSRRDGQETQSFGGRGGIGPQREQADPLDRLDHNVLGKVVLKPSENQEIKFMVDYLRGETLTTAKSAMGVTVRGITTDRLRGDDERERTRLSVAYRLQADTGLFDELQVQLYRQHTDATQVTKETRLSTNPTANAFRTRTSEFEQTVTGATVQLNRNLTLGGVPHRVTYGGEIRHTESDNLRLGDTVNANTGQPIPEFTPFPTKAFPKTTALNVGAFVQNEIGFLNDALRITPALRFDYFSLDPQQNDPDYFAGNPGSPPVEDFSDSAFSFKLGAVYQFDPVWGLFAQYAEGFRAPAYDDVNVGFANIASRYRAIPNPNLKPETSRGVELGLRGASALGSLNLSIFHNRYKNFIESLAFVGIDPEDGFQVFQSRNRGRVEISGAELRGDVNLRQVSDPLANFRLRTSLAYAKGTDEELNQPLNSIDPLKGILGLAYDHPSQTWGSELIWTVTRRKTQVASGNNPQFRTPGYGKLDLLAYYRFDRHTVLNAGVFNLTDQKHWLWSETLIGLSPDNPALARLTEPGRHFSLSLKTEW